MGTMINREKLNWNKIEKLPTVNDMLDKKYGKGGSHEREAFKEEAYSFYFKQITKRTHEIA